MNQAMSRRGVWCTAVLYLINSVYIRGHSAAGQDVWLSAVLATVVFAGVGWLMSRLTVLYPRRNLFEMLFAARSRLTAVLVSWLYILYGLLTVTRSVQSYEEFVQSCVLTETPHYVIAAALLLTSLLFLKKGTQILSQWSCLVFPLFAVLWLTLLGMAFARFEWGNLLPVMKDWKAAAVGAGELLAFPGGELIFLTSLFGALGKGGDEADGKVTGLWMGIIGTAGACQLLILLANVLVLSAPVVEKTRYATYFMTSTIGVGDFFRHVEILTTFISQLAVLTNVCVIILFVTQGMAQLMGAADHRLMALPVVLLVYGLSCFVSYSSAAALTQAVGDWRLPAFAVQFVGPLCILCPRRKIRIRTQ